MTRGHHWPPTGTGLLPFVEGVGERQASESSQSGAKGGPLCDRLCPRVDHAASDGWVFRPGRYQSPAHVPCSPRLAPHDGQNFLGGSYVVRRIEPEPIAVELEPPGKLSQVGYFQTVSSTHGNEILVYRGSACWGTGASREEKVLHFACTFCTICTQLAPSAPSPPCRVHGFVEYMGSWT